jgi:hypothetical protein
MPTQEKIATALLTADLPNEEVAGLLLELADVKTPVRMQTPPSSASVAKVASKGWAKVATAVLSGTKEFLGSRLVKHNSVQVKRLLAEFGTDEESLRTLHSWAVAKDSEALSHLIVRLDPLWLLGTVEGGTKYNSRMLHTIGARAVSAEPGSLDRMVNLDPQTRNIMLTAASVEVAIGHVPNCDLGRLLSLVDTNGQRDITRYLCRAFNQPVSKSMLDQIVKHPAAWSEVLSIGFPSAPSYEESAARMFIAANPDCALFVLSSNWDQSLFEVLLGLDRFDVINAMLSDERVKILTPQELTKALMALPSAAKSQQGYRPDTVNRNLLRLIDHELETGPLLAYLRNCDDQTTWKWLCGEFSQKPRPGEVQALMDDPGFAFGWVTVPVSGSYQYRPVKPEDVSTTLAYQFEKIVNQPWCDEMVDACGYKAFEDLLRTYNQVGQNYIAKRFTAALGNDVTLWRSTIAQFATSKLSIGKTLSAARRLGAARS